MHRADETAERSRKVIMREKRKGAMRRQCDGARILRVQDVGPESDDAPFLF